MRREGLSIAVLQEIAQQAGVFSSVLAWSGGGVDNLEVNGVPFAGSTDEIAGDYYATLGIRPALGRFITPADIGLDRFTPSRVAVIGYRSWQQRYRGDPAVVGKTLPLNGKPFTIIGVHPESFSGLIRETDADATVPITAYAPDATHVYDRRNAYYTVIGRMRDGADPAAARARMEAIWPSIRAATLPDSAPERELFRERRIRIEAAPPGISYLRARLTRPLYILLGVGGLVLVLACVNLTSIALARAIGRTAEFRIRLALGAGRWRLVRASLVESFLLAAGGAVPGLALAYWASGHMARFMWRGLVPLTLGTAPDARVIAFTLAAALLASLLFGLIPAWRAGQQNAGALIQHTNARTAVGLGFAGRALVAIQFALSFAILAGALLFSRSVGHVLHRDFGFRTDHLLVAELFPRSTYSGIDKQANGRQLVADLRSMPGVAAVSFAYGRPIGLPGWKQTILPTDVSADYRLIAPGFFDTLGMRIQRGRDFDFRDDLSRPLVAIVSAKLARIIDPSGDAIGQHVRIGDLKSEFEIVGISSDATLDDPRTQDAPAIYAAVFQRPDYLGYGSVVVRTRENPSHLAGALRQRIEHLGREYPLRIDTVDEELAAALVPENTLALLTGFFGVVALLLAGIGLYGLLSYTIARRTRELGVFG
jgi:predicted permease